MIDKFVRDKSVWETPSVDPHANFVYEAQCLNGPGEKNWNIDVLRASNLARKTGDKVSDFKVNVASYECGSGEILPRFLEKKVNTRTAALKIIKDFYKSQTKCKEHPWAEMESFMRYQHYCAELGYDIIGCEIGCCMSGYPVSIAFTRGAARQFGKAWFADFSLWGAGTEGICGTMLNYSGNFYAFNAWGEASVCDPTGGQGVNAVQRAHLYVYLSGASWLINEAGGNNAFYPEKEDDGYYKLTPHGRVFQKIYDFVKKNPDRGIPYTPFGIVLDYYHGLPFGLWNGNRVFESLSPNSGDIMTQKLLSIFYPGWNEYAKLGKNQLTDTPFGDSADIILQNASQNVLDSYPCLILSGDIVLSEEESERFRRYAANGGLLILNSIYLEFLPEFKKNTDENVYTVNYSKGKVIVYSDDYDLSRLPGILEDVCMELIPFSVEGRIQYLVSVKNGGLILTLINSNGVTKESDKAEIFDYSYTEEVKIRYKGVEKIKSVKELFTEKAYPASEFQAIVLKPGETAVLEFEFDNI